MKFLCVESLLTDLLKYPNDVVVVAHQDAKGIFEGFKDEVRIGVMVWG